MPIKLKKKKKKKNDSNNLKKKKNQNNLKSFKQYGESEMIIT